MRPPEKKRLFSPYAFARPLLFLGLINCYGFLPLQRYQPKKMQNERNKIFNFCGSCGQGFSPAE